MTFIYADQLSKLSPLKERFSPFAMVESGEAFIILQHENQSRVNTRTKLHQQIPYIAISLSFYAHLKYSTHSLLLQFCTVHFIQKFNKIKFS